MAKSKGTVFLGFDDEEITAKHAVHLNSTENKIGGTPNWPSDDITVPSCPICSSVRPLIVQLYAPLDQSKFHRTLYIFSCINPACSTNSKSWVCVRTQHLDTPSHEELLLSGVVPPPTTGKKQKKSAQKRATTTQKINWCSGADDWGDSGVEANLEEMDTEADDFQTQFEENGNMIDKNDMGFQGAAAASASLDLDDDDEDESNSMENELICGLAQLDMLAVQNCADDPNANCAEGVAAAGGLAGAGPGVAGATAKTYAEIEGAETDLVLVETPKKPERDLIALLKHTPSVSGVVGPLAKSSDVTIKPYFIVVDIEPRQVQGEYDYYGGALSADHIRELYHEYKRQDEATHSPSGVGAVGGSSSTGAAHAEESEVYENSLPAHGDLIFHKFITTIQQYPGQILRYSRDTFPLLIAPLTESLPKCQHCNGETICEVQILSTLIPKLRLQQTGECVPIEYGNVLVFTCLKSCWDTPDKMRYEQVIVQSEK